MFVTILLCGIGTIWTLGAQRVGEHTAAYTVDPGSVRTLHGSWLFYPGRFIGRDPSPIDAISIEVPSSWSLYGIPSRGAGTYRLVLHLDGASLSTLALRIGFVPTAYRLIVNGDVVGGVGEPSLDPRRHRPQWYPAVYRFDAPVDGVLDIRIEVANWEHSSAGLRSTVHFGTAERIDRFHQFWTFRDWLFIGAGVFIALYHFALFATRRSDRVLLWFALAALCFTVRAGYSSAVYWNALLPAVPWGLMIRIEYLGLYGVALFFVLYAYRMFEMRIGPIPSWLYIGVVTCAAVIAIVAPIMVMTFSVRVVQVALAVAFVWIGVRMVGLVRRGVRGARAFLVVGILAVVSVVFDSLRYYGLVSGPPVHNAVGLALLITQSLSLARRFSNALADQERLSIALTEANDRLEVMAREDSVTGLPNRVALYALLEDEILRSERLNRMFGVLFVDLDNFKHVNDTLGHLSGDELLRSVASRFRRIIGKTDRLFRLGGDEFVVVCLDLQTREAPVRVADAIVHGASHTFRVAGHDVLIGASIGVSDYPRHGGDPYTLLQNADAAMYCAKRAGRGRYVIFAEEMALRSNEHLSVGGRLPRALQMDLLSIVFQPQLDAVSGRIVSAEVLLRWTDPELGEVPPSRFVPVAEDNGLIVKIGQRVLDKGAAYYRQLCGDDIDLSINVSAGHLTNEAIVADVENVLQSGAIPSERLILEVTEHTMMRHRARSIEVLHELRRRGVRIALDDFGTGYSSLSNIRALPIDELKIDRSFVAGMDHNPQDRQIVRWIVNLAKELGLVVCAEGVETETQRDTLITMGVDKLQGYLTGAPMSFERFAAALCPGSTGVQPTRSVRMASRSKRWMP